MLACSGGFCLAVSAASAASYFAFWDPGCILLYKFKQPQVFHLHSLYI